MAVLITRSRGNVVMDLLRENGEVVSFGSTCDDGIIEEALVYFRECIIDEDEFLEIMEQISDPIYLGATYCVELGCYV